MEERAGSAIHLIDLYDFLKGEGKLLLCFMLFGISVGVVMALTLSVSNQFESSGLIRGGSVGRAGVDEANAEGSYVEPIEVLAEKLRSPNYYKGKPLDPCLGESGFEVAQNMISTLSVTVKNNLSGVLVAYRASSEEKASECLEKILDVIVENQKDLMSRNLTHLVFAVEKKKNTVDELRTTIEKLGIYKRAQDNDSDNSTEAESVAAIYELKKLLLVAESEIYGMQIMLKPPFTQEAHFLLTSTVKHRLPLSRAGIVITSVIVSLGCGLLLVFFKKSFGRLKMQLRERHKSASIEP